MNNSATPSAVRRHEPHNVALQDMRPYALGTELLDDELLIVENLATLPADTQAVQTSFFTIGYCTAGKADFVLNDRSFHVEPGDLFLAFGQQTFSEIQFSPDFSAQAIFQNLSFVQETLMSMTQLWPYLLSLMEQPVLSLDETEKALVVADYRALHARMLDHDHCFAREVIKTCLQSFYLDLCQLLERRGSRRDNFNTRTFNIFYRFMQLLSRNFGEQRSVNWYADQLQLTPKYLSQLIKNVSGRTVGQWVSVLVVMEIKNLLRNTDLSIKEISTGLNFPSQSLMGRYFKNYTGLSPLDYRRR